MELVVKFLAKSTIWVRAYVYHPVTGALEDPTSINVTIADADGEKKVDDKDMAKDSQGVYDYYYTVGEDPAEGWWNGEVWVTNGSGETAKKSFDTFSVEVKKGL